MGKGGQKFKKNSFSKLCFKQENTLEPNLQ